MGLLLKVVRFVPVSYTHLMTGCSSTNTVSEDLVPTDYVNPFIGASTSVGAAGVYHGDVYKRQIR